MPRNAKAETEFYLYPDSMEITPMKSLLAVVALSFAVAASAPVFAQGSTAKTQAECEKMEGMRWDQGSQQCVKK